jgi:hypothetical protein
VKTQKFMMLCKRMKKEMKISHSGQIFCKIELFAKMWEPSEGICLLDCQPFKGVRNFKPHIQ